MNAGMLHIRLGDVEWSEIAPGVERGELPPDMAGAGAALLRFAAGARSGAHRHPEGEELFLLSGSLRVGEVVMGVGDYLYTPPNGVNDAEAYEDTIVFQHQSAPIEFI
ncbi:cupin domain-containing protein [Nocardia sp. NPDC019395]|uniref:cupin domain-containing protein n=1 Tax=Nocardia sp. NPDC019395 TaxID=3154686 RepID=UPI00340C905B